MTPHGGMSGVEWPSPVEMVSASRHGVSAYLVGRTSSAVYLCRLIGGERPFWLWCNYWPEPVEGVG